MFPKNFDTGGSNFVVDIMHGGSLVVVFCVGEGGDGGGGSGGHFRGVTPAAGQREPAAFRACADAAAPVVLAGGGDREQFVNALEALVEEVLQEEKDRRQ